MREHRPLALLRRLDGLRGEYGAHISERKRALLAALERRRLPRAADVLRLHEVLCFLRAYPDDEAVLTRVEAMLDVFDERADLGRHRKALVDSGIAGTAIYFRFFQPTASWLARRFAGRMRIDWKRFRRKDLLDRWLSLLALYAETPALDEFAIEPQEWSRRMKGKGETDAAWLIRRFDALRVDPFVREKLYDELDVPILLEPSGGKRPRAGPRAGGRKITNASEGDGRVPTPSRTHAIHRRAPRAFQTSPLSRSRPELPREILRPPVSIRAVSRAEGRALIDLARDAMITRSRDLDVFSWGDPDDVRMIDCGRGLAFACIGAVPERRLLLEAVYGFLTLKNGVPIGYVLTSALFGSSEIAYNVFETYRGAEAGAVYGRVLSTAHALFGSDAFTIYPYQLGDDNEEAIRSGAWWFYQKMGFVPRERRAVRLMKRELRCMTADPSHRSSAATLRQLARSNLFYQMGQARDDVIGVLSLPDVGLAVTHHLSDRFGSDRERAERTSSRDAMHLLGVRSLHGFSAGARLAWSRWAPLVTILPGLDRWSRRDRKALVEVMRAKGGRRESEFVALFDRHRPLRRAIRALARPEE